MSHQHPPSADPHRADTAARIRIATAADHGETTHRHARRRSGRWLLVISIVLFGHMAALAWLGLHRAHDVEPPTKPHVVVALLKARPIETTSRAPGTKSGNKAASPPPVEPHASPRAGALQGIAPVRPAAKRPVTVPVTTPPTDAPQTLADQPTSVAAPADPTAASNAAASSAIGTAGAAGAQGAGGASGAGTSGAGTNAANPHGTNDGEHYALMPSSDLVYDTFYNGAQNQSGTLHWRTNGKQYELVVSMPVPFIGTYSFISQGHIDAFGLAPDVYTEHRGRRGTDISRFDRDGTTHQVAFTRTPQTVPLPDGAQDRFSMIFQLASLVRGNPQRYQPGVTREFDVIDSNSAEIWPIQTIGPETVVRPDGTIQAVHFMRLPRHAGDTRRIDIWLAPSLDWIPVRIMQTEPNGTQIELLYRSRTRMSPTSVRMDSTGAVAESRASAPQGAPVTKGSGS